MKNTPAFFCLPPHAAPVLPVRKRPYGLYYAFHTGKFPGQQHRPSFTTDQPSQTLAPGRDNHHTSMIYDRTHFSRAHGYPDKEDPAT